MTTPIFIDTSALYVLVDREDPRHESTRDFVEKNNRPLITSEYVFSEAITIIRYDFGHSAAQRLGERLRASQFCGILPVEPEDISPAWEIFCRYDDQKFSFADCTSFALMTRLGLPEALTFDHHFRTAGFVTLPPR